MLIRATGKLALVASLAAVMMTAAPAWAPAFAEEAQIEVAASSDRCHQQCVTVENQCRMAAKDLDSSKCNAKYLACVAACRAKR